MRPFPSYLAQALTDPASYGDLTAAEVALLRQQLSVAINVTVALSGDLDTATAATMIVALQAVVGAAANIDQALFDQLITLIQALAASAGAAASSFLAIIEAMLQARGVGTAANAAAISSSLASLSVSILSDAVCNELPTAYNLTGLYMRTSFQSSYANNSLDLGNSAKVHFGSQFGTLNASATATVDDAICTKSQALRQDTAPFVTPVNGTFVYGRGSGPGRREGRRRRGRGRWRGQDDVMGVRQRLGTQASLLTRHVCLLRGRAAESH